MGGKGSGRPTKEDSIVRSFVPSPIGQHNREPLILPDRLGDHSHGTFLRTPEKDEDLVNKKFVDDSCSDVIPLVNALPAVVVLGKVVYHRPSKHLYLGID
jgi:hypothetical protein